MEIIDSYSHCGISKYEPIERVRGVMRSGGVARAVLVQHLGEYDNRYLQDVVAADPDHLAGVCMVDHQLPDASGILKHWQQTGCFRGVRLSTDVLAVAPQLFSTAAEAGLVIVLYAPDGIGSFVVQVDALLRDHPDARVVLTHLGNPPVGQSAEAEAYRAVFRLARYPHVYFQISGMKMFCPYPHEPLYTWITSAIDTFGPDRLLWGSNYPVVGDTDDYLADLRLVTGGQLPFSKPSIPAIAGGNARRLWFDK